MTSYGQILLLVIPVFALMGLGVLARRINWLTEEADASLLKLVVNILYPCLILDHVPANAGPLNSSSLVHRSLALMREVSPGYLRHFLSYVDALAWPGQLGGDGAVPGNDTPSAKPVDNPAGRKTKRAAKSR